ncbi:hypothetical protein QFC20_005905 [Naganishia adeliensis]|uniref:Uncharacterized protein n=1 Tax=Naganishia adeliensis TaxID=92952 RepID=A0ACC2VHF3_9TREE|nr:hypothetical protein QFC20_005905 [Naganishia adeliensis]
MFKASVISAFCALLLADASLAVVVKRDCRALHQDHDYPGGEIPYECTPAGQQSAGDGTDWLCLSDISLPPARRQRPQTLQRPIPGLHRLLGHPPHPPQRPPPGSAPTPPPTKQQPANSSDENPYLGKFYQIRPAANDTMCLSAFVSWDNTIGEADSINLEPCECDKPEVQNKWTFDLTEDKSHIMIGKPKSANDTTWCIDAGTTPNNDDHPHLWRCAPDVRDEEDQGAQDFCDVQHWNLNQTTGEISINYREYNKYCLDVENGHLDGRPIQIWECTGGVNQQWHVTPVNYTASSAS